MTHTQGSSIPNISVLIVAPDNITERVHNKDLSKCIRAVQRGQIWISNEDLEHIMNALNRSKPFQIDAANGSPLLTPREIDVVHLVADGLKNHEIARRLKVTQYSVRNYVYRIFDKVGVSTRIELTLYVFSRRDQTH